MKCDRAKPRCLRCQTRALPCTYSKADKTTAPRNSGESPVSVQSSNQLGDQAQDTPMIDETDRSEPPSPAGLQGISASSPATEEDAWLYASELPGLVQLRTLVDAFFTNVHPLRSLGFLHKPSFLKALDHGELMAEYGEASIYTICALGARFIRAPSSEKYSTKVPGRAWGEKARDLARVNSCNPSVQNVTFLLLFCEYGLRTDENSLVFMLAGCAYRMMRLLRLDCEPLPDHTQEPPPTPAELTQLEIYRRLVWSCYILDSGIGAGVSTKVCWTSETPTIPLPCRDIDFLQQTATAPVYLDVDQATAGQTTPVPDIRQQTIRLMYLRRAILECIRTPYEAGGARPPPWDRSSQFMNLLQRLDEWHANLPKHLLLNDMNVYIQKEQKNLTAFLSMHCAYYVSISDLTRITLAGYNFPLAAAFQGAPADFVSKHQQRCYQSADALTQVFSTGFSHGAESVDDMISSAAAFESTKVQVIYLTTVARRDRGLREHIRGNIDKNLRVLTVFHRHPDSTNVFLTALCPFLTHFGFPDIAARWKPYQRAVLVPRPPSKGTPFPPPGTYADLDETADSGVVGPSEVLYLNQLATYRLMRIDAQSLDVSRASLPRGISERVHPSQVDAHHSDHGSSRDMLEPLATQNSENSLQQHQYGQAFWPEPFMTTGHTQFEQSAEYTAAGALTDMSAMPSGVPPDFLGDSTLAGTVDEEYYQRMAGYISDYITWDGNLGMFE